MNPETFDVADQIVSDLMTLDAEDRRKVLQALALIFCTGCGMVHRSDEIAVSSVSSICIHDRALPNGLMDRQRELESQDAGVRRAALLIRSEFSA